MTFEQYEATLIARMAVERRFITIGEAIARMKGSSEDASARIDHAVLISGFETS